MSRFLTKLGLFGLCQLVALTALVFVGPGPIDNPRYLAAVSLKGSALRKTAAPRVILVGGSNLAFGVDSTAISRELGVPTLNLGTHVGVPIEVLLNQVADVVTAGDLIVLSPEYSASHAGDERFFTDVVVDMLACDPWLAPRIPSEFWLRSLQEDLSGCHGLGRLAAFARYRLDALLFGSPSDQGAEVYRSAAFDARGDVCVRPPVRRISFEADIPRTYSTESLPALITTLNDFSASCTEAGARVVFVFPPLPESVMATEGCDVDRVAAVACAALEVPILNKPWSLPDADFYDTAYHLSFEGRSKRTVELLALLSSHR